MRRCALNVPDRRRDLLQSQRQANGSAVIRASGYGLAEEVLRVAHFVARALRQNCANVYGDLIAEFPVVNDYVGPPRLVPVRAQEDGDALGPQVVALHELAVRVKACRLAPAREVVGVLAADEREAAPLPAEVGVEVPAVGGGRHALRHFQIKTFVLRIDRVPQKLHGLPPPEAQGAAAHDVVVQDFHVAVIPV